MLNVVRDIIIYNNTRNYFSKDYEEKLDKYSNRNIEKYIELSNNAFNLSNILKKSTNQKTLFETYFIKMALLFNENNLSTEIEMPKKEEIKLEIINNSKNDIIVEKADNSYKKVRINNSFVGANKDLKLNFVNKFSEINDYL